MTSNPAFYIFQNHSYVDLYPIQFGKEDCPPLHSFGPTKKNHYLFHYVLSGSGRFYVTEEQESYQLVAGQGFLMSPDQIYSYEADKENPWSYLWVEFDGLKAKYFLQQAGLSHQQPIFSQKKPASTSPVYREMQQILASYDRQPSHVIGSLYLLMGALIEESLTKKPYLHDDSKEFYIREAINFIEKNFQHPISIGDLANQCNLSPYYFSRLFKEQMSISPQQFIIQYRLNKACELLQGTSLTLREIAEQIGYSNQFNLSNAFKRQYKQTPTEWRAKHSYLPPER